MSAPSGRSFSEQRDSTRRASRLPAWSVLASILFHAVVATFGWYALSPVYIDNFRLRATLRPARHTKIAWTSNAFQQHDANIERGRGGARAEPEGHVDRDRQEQVVPTNSPDEVYLPQELLTQPAMPAQEIDLQGDAPLGPGSFRMRLWISKDGVVTKIELEDTNIPAWFTDRITEQFRQSKFVPGIRNDQSIASILRVEITF